MKLEGIKDIGSHSRDVATEIIQFGQSKEVEELRRNEQFCSLQVEYLIKLKQ